MPSPPITYLERRWAAGYSGTNSLIKAATQTQDREAIPPSDKDSARNITTAGRRFLLSTGRYIYENCLYVKTAVDQMALHAVGTFTPQYYGRNAEWGASTEDWLKDGDSHIDIRGAPYSMDHFRRLLVISLIRDGELGVHLTQDEFGNAKIQCIPSHRIGSQNYSDSVVKGGRWDGARLIDGVILGDYGQALAYRVYGENQFENTYTDISSNDFALVFVPDYTDQVRGWSKLGAAAFQCQDTDEGNSANLIAAKLAAMMPVIIRNKSGYADSATTRFNAPATSASEITGAAQSLPQKIMSAGTIAYFREGTKEGIEFPKADRPTANAQLFRSENIRDILSSFGWSSDFSRDPTKIGGVNGRIVMVQINASRGQMQKLGCRPICQRIYGWRTAKGMQPNKDGVARLAHDDDWWKFEFQGPPRLTGDAKYDSDVDIQEMHAGVKAPQEVVEKNGGFWEDVQDNAIEWTARLKVKCYEKTKAIGIPDIEIKPEEIAWQTPNGVPPEQPEPEPATKDE